ncbi:MAG: hypothetical protein RMJ37_07905 [Spirochaetia bacterium]|nr:hypothetical protein [Spirochaetota bacterium]MCX8096057.1 hypothetical protein [Spirochaetota bacterium]MDW8113237.1 hypothetical protein [Spirochaetia bacterium]
MRKRNNTTTEQKSNINSELRNFVSNNLWGLIYTTIAVLSVLIIIFLGFGVFILLLIVGGLAFLLGNSKDKNIPPLQNIKNFIDSINDKMKNLKL